MMTGVVVVVVVVGSVVGSVVVVVDSAASVAITMADAAAASNFVFKQSTGIPAAIANATTNKTHSFKVFLIKTTSF